MATTRRSRLHGMQRCGEQVFAIFAFTIFGRHTPRGSAPAALRTNGSRSCLRQGDAKVFKKYSQMKLQMKREALAKLNRLANESGLSFGTAQSPSGPGYGTVA